MLSIFDVITLRGGLNCSSLVSDGGASDVMLGTLLEAAVKVPKESRSKALIAAQLIYFARMRLVEYVSIKQDHFCCPHLLCCAFRRDY